jgi:hypothetical protein
LPRLGSIGKADVFELMLPKRGKRAGITDASGTLITSVMIRHARTPGKIFWELADASDTRQDESNARSPQVVKAFFSLDRGDGVSLETLARRLRCSAKTVRRDLKDGKVKTDDGETLVVRDSRVFSEDVV